MSEPMLAVTGLGVRYGPTPVIEGLDLTVERGEVLTLLGLNGAGKSTLLKAVAGLLPYDGSVSFDGTSVTRWPGSRINRAGLAYVPQSNGVFPGLTVADHLRIARHFRDDRVDVQREVLAWFPVLEERMAQDAQTLSGGQRKMLSFVMALSCAPKLVLLDEPTEGVAPVVRQQLVGALQHVIERASVVLVEQNLDTALAVGGRCHVIERGTIVESGMIGDLHRAGVIESRLSV